MSRSELESFVLGLIWQHGPCSPYEIRRILTDSPSTQWSASAGAIYPLMTRLERAGLITGKAKSDGKRKRREYAISAKGRTALKRWIGPPFAEEVISVTADPLRTRARFLAALTPKERRAWIIAAEAAVDAVEANVQRWHARYGSGESKELALLTRHAELELAFRRAWLKHVREA